MQAQIRPKTVLVGPAVLAILGQTVAGVVALSGAEAASKVTCGDTITTDTTLHHDLLNCPNKGLVIGADNITLDLNSHQITSDRRPTPGCTPPFPKPCDTGVVSNGHDGVTVMDGSVRGFRVGVWAGHLNGRRVNDNRVLGVSASGSGHGIEFFHVAQSLVRNSSAHYGYVACVVEASQRVRVVHNSFRNNSGQGISVTGSFDNLIKENLITHDRSTDGISLEEGATRNEVRNNRIIGVEPSQQGVGSGIELESGSRNLISGNRLSRGRDGIRVETGHDNLVAHNVVVRARAGIRLGLAPFIGGANTVVRGNLVRQSRADGILVTEKDRHALLKGNTATGGQDDGFDVRTRTAKLTRNRGLGNADLGIAAVRGVADGGGNIARHNGDPRQCTHIACN